MRKKYGINIIVVFIIIIMTVTNHKVYFLKMPDTDKMLEYQFNLFTIASVLAGFSFTVLVLLSGLFSEKMVEKIKNTTIVTDKSRRIVNSIIWFGISALISLLFIIGVADFVNKENKYFTIKELLFVGEIICIFVGVVHFLRATKGVYFLIQKIYGCDIDEIEKKKKNFEEAMTKNQKKD